MVVKKAIPKKKVSSSRKSNSKGKKKNSSIDLLILPNYNLLTLDIFIEFVIGLCKSFLVFAFLSSFVYLLDVSLGSELFVNYFLILIIGFLSFAIFSFLIPNIHRMLLIDHRNYCLSNDRLTFHTGIFNLRREFISLDDIIHVDIENHGLVAKLFGTNTITIRTKISYYDPIIIPCVSDAHLLYEKIDQIITDYKFK